MAESFPEEEQSEEEAGGAKFISEPTGKESCTHVLLFFDR